MNMLPDYAGNRHRAHEAHDDDAFAFHDLGLRAQRTQSIQQKAFMFSTSATSAVKFFDDRRWIAGHHHVWSDRFRHY